MSGQLAFVVVTILSVSCASAADESPFKIATKRVNDKIELCVEEDKAVISVRSQFGISHATIERLDENWPDAVVLQLHLKGLESLKITNGKMTLNAALSSHDVRLWKDDNEDSLLNPKSSYWMEIRMVGKDGKPAKSIPPEDGYFEMKLPKVFFEGNPKSITVNRIDFYRN